MPSTSTYTARLQVRDQRPGRSRAKARDDLRDAIRGSWDSGGQFIDRLEDRGFELLGPGIEVAEVVSDE